MILILAIQFLALLGCCWCSYKISQRGNRKHIWASGFFTGGCFSGFIVNLFIFILEG